MWHILASESAKIPPPELQITDEQVGETAESNELIAVVDKKHTGTYLIHIGTDRTVVRMTMLNYGMYSNTAGAIYFYQNAIINTKQTWSAVALGVDKGMTPENVTCLLTPKQRLYFMDIRTAWGACN